MNELRLILGKFGEGIDPREHICRRCHWSVSCLLRHALNKDRFLVGTKFDTAVVKECFLFQEEKGGSA